jgi:hypothetical protein
MTAARSNAFQSYLSVLVMTERKILAKFSPFLYRANQVIQMEVLKGQLPYTPFVFKGKLCLNEMNTN